MVKTTSRKSKEKQGGESQPEGKQKMTTPGIFRPRSVQAVVQFEIIGTGNDNTLIGYVTSATGKNASQFTPGKIITPSHSSVTIDMEELAKREG